MRDVGNNYEAATNHEAIMHGDKMSDEGQDRTEKQEMRAIKKRKERRMRKVKKNEMKRKEG